MGSGTLLLLFHIGTVDNDAGFYPAVPNVQTVSGNFKIQIMLIKDISRFNENQLNDFLKKNRKKIDELFLTNHISFFTPLHWDTISQYVSLSEEFMHKFRNKINWQKAFKYQYYSIDFIENKKFAGKLVWKKILTNVIVDEELIEKYWVAGKMPPSYKKNEEWPIFTSRQFSRKFIIRHPEKLHMFMYTQSLWEEYILENYWLIVGWCNRESSINHIHTRYQHWNEFRNTQKHLPDSFFSQFQYHCKEDAYRNLTEETIIAFGIEKINWLNVSIYTPLNLKFISTYKQFLVSHYVNERIGFIKSADEIANKLINEYKDRGRDDVYLIEVNDFLHNCQKEQLYEIALGVYETIKETAYLNPFIFHQTACLYALVQNSDKAIIEIEKAVQHNYEYIDLLFSDRDLDIISENARFRVLKNSNEVKKMSNNNYR